MALKSETLSEITAFVRGGFEERGRIVDIFCEEMYAPGELDIADVEVAVEQAFASLEAEKVTLSLNAKELKCQLITTGYFHAKCASQSLMRICSEWRKLETEPTLSWK